MKVVGGELCACKFFQMFHAGGRYGTQSCEMLDVKYMHHG